MFLTGLYLWRRFREDFEVRTLGGVLAVPSVFLFVMALRIIFQNLGWISDNLAFTIFFVEYIIILLVLLLFAFPRFLYLVSSRPVVKRLGLILGILLYIAYLVLHFTQKEKTIAHYAPHGLVFELPYLEKVFLAIIFVIFFIAIIYRVLFHFHQWRKTKTFPYKLLTYLLFFLTFLIPIFTILPLEPWQIVFGYILSLAGFLGVYFVASQQFIKEEKIILTPREEIKELKEPIDKEARLQEITIRIESKMKELREEIEKLKREVKKK